MSFRYILRYCIAPDFAEDERIAELTEACIRGKIAEVMLFFNAEELYCGYPDNATVEKFISLAVKIRKALNASGIDMSINPWTTLGHLARGRKFDREVVDCQPMVGETGFVSPIVACPLDKKWQQYLSELFARFAREIKPVAIWIEDDWRLHNHDIPMGYGGCFCPLHLRKFEELSGIVTDRETLKKNILAPGTPHPWRKIWSQVCRISLLEPAIAVEKAVHAANPDVRLGLMSSDPDVHSIEGREWNLLHQAFAPEGKLLLRPHMPPYTEQFALMISPGVTRMTMSEFDHEIESYPELEGSPRCGHYSKSGTYIAFQCLHAAVAGCQGITLNQFDMMGNGFALDRKFPDNMAAIKPFLDAVTALNINDGNAAGVKIIYSPEAADFLQTAEDASSLSDLTNDSRNWSEIFFKLGISHGFTRQVLPGEIHAVSGQTLRAFSDEKIVELLSGRVILDAPSVKILCERGFGDMIGVESAEYIDINSGVAYEEIGDGKAVDYGVDTPRMNAARCSFRVLDMHTLPGVEKFTCIRHYSHRVITPGAIGFCNRAGGKILSIAYPLGTAQFNMAFFNNFRRIFFHKILQDFLAASDILLGCDEPLQCYRISQDGETILAIFNPTHDLYESVRFIAPGIDGKMLQILDDNGEWQSADIENLPDSSMICHRQLPHLKVIVMRTVSK